MKLYLAQHGEACSKQEDLTRPLTEKGRADIERLACFLGKANIKVGRILHSGKLRAQQTAEIIATKIAADIDIESHGLLDPDDDPKAFAWQDDSWDKNMLVVGHLPFMARLVSYLLIENEDAVITAFKPGSMVCLQCVDSKQWQLHWMIIPELL